MLVTNQAIKKNIDLIDYLRILKNRQRKKDDRNQKSLFKNDEVKSPKASNKLIIISNKEENTNILELRLKKAIFFSQTRYNSICLINIQY